MTFRASRIFFSIFEQLFLCFNKFMDPRRREDDEGVLFHNGGFDLAVAGFIEPNGLCGGFA